MNEAVRLDAKEQKKEKKRKRKSELRVSLLVLMLPGPCVQCFENGEHQTCPEHKY